MVLALLVTAAPLTTCAGTVEIRVPAAVGAVGEKLDVGLLERGAEAMGALQMDVVYDPRKRMGRRGSFRYLAAMTRRGRLMATLRGEPVDRPAFSFYEINGTESTDCTDPFNIYSDCSWKPLIDLAAERTDRVVMRSPPFRRSQGDTAPAVWKAMPEQEGRRERAFDAEGNERTLFELRVGQRILTERTLRERDINTVWTTEHLLKDVDDFKAWLDLPEDPTPPGDVDVRRIVDLETRLGDSGLVMLDTADPLCGAAPLFDFVPRVATPSTRSNRRTKATWNLPTCASATDGNWCCSGTSKRATLRTCPRRSSSAKCAGRWRKGPADAASS